MSSNPSYRGPASPDHIDDADVHQALDFLIAVEPDPDDDEIETLEDYEEHMAPFAPDLDRAMDTLRRYAQQTQPSTLQEMQDRYHDFTNDERYLETPEISAVVTSALGEAWDGVGPWRR